MVTLYSLSISSAWITKLESARLVVPPTASRANLPTASVRSASWLAVRVRVTVRVRVRVRVRVKVRLGLGSGLGLGLGFRSLTRPAGPPPKTAEKRRSGSSLGSRLG